MRFKLDENLDARWRVPLEEAGHQVSTVAEEALEGTEDRTLAEICRERGSTVSALPASTISTDLL